MTDALDYAPRQLWYKKKRLRRGLTCLLVLAALAIAAWQFGPGIYQRCRLLYWQRKCLDYVSPPSATSPLPPSPPSELTTYVSCLPPSSPLAPLVAPPRLLLGPWDSPDPTYQSMFTLERDGRQRLCVVKSQLTSGYRHYLILGPGRRAPFPVELEITLIEPATFFRDPALLTVQRFTFDHPDIVPAVPMPDLDNTRVDAADKSSLLVRVDPYYPGTTTAAAGVTPAKPLIVRFRLAASGDKLEQTFEPVP